MILTLRPRGPSRVEEGDPERVAQELREVLLLDLDTTPFRELHGDDPLIGAQVRRRPGLRPVRRGTVTQALVAALAGQLITSRAASAIEWRIAARAAPACGDLRLPPTRAEIAALSAAELAACGLSPSRAAALARLVRTLDPFGAWAGLASLHLLAHPWAAAPAPGGAFGLRPGARWTRRTSPAGPRATPPAPAPRPRTSPRPPAG